MNNNITWLLGTLILSITSIIFFALLGFLIWHTGNLLILIALIATPILWVRISVNKDSEATRGKDDTSKKN